MWPPPPNHTYGRRLFGNSHPGSEGKASACSAGDPGLIPGSGRSPEKESATYSSILAWGIPWTEEPGSLQSTGLQRLGHDWAASLSFHFGAHGSMSDSELDRSPPKYWVDKLFPLTPWSFHPPSPKKFLPINFTVGSYVVSWGCVHLVISSSRKILLLVSASGCDLEPPSITSDSKSKDVRLQDEGLWTGPPCDLKSLNS